LEINELTGLLWLAPESAAKLSQFKTLSLTASLTQKANYTKYHFTE
jgi:hypothetical protein